LTVLSSSVPQLVPLALFRPGVVAAGALAPPRVACGQIRKAIETWFATRARDEYFFTDSHPRSSVLARQFQAWSRSGNPDDLNRTLLREKSKRPSVASRIQEFSQNDKNSLDGENLANHNPPTVSLGPVLRHIDNAAGSPDAPPRRGVPRSRRTSHRSAARTP